MEILGLDEQIGISNDGNSDTEHWKTGTWTCSSSREDHNKDYLIPR